MDPSNETVIWSSEQFNLDDCISVDVKATAGAVNLRQSGENLLHDLHLTPEQADSIAYALLEGAQRARGARS